MPILVRLAWRATLLIGMLVMLLLLATAARVRDRLHASLGRFGAARLATIVVAALLVGVCGLAACGGGTSGSTGGIAKGSHNLTLTATSGTASHSTTLTVVVQ